MERQLVWRLVRATGESAECHVQHTQAGGLGITIQCGSDPTFLALATNASTARDLIAERKALLLRDGWTAEYDDPAW